MKNKIIKRKLEMTIVVLSLIFIAAMKLITMTASPVSAEVYVPSLFYNDKAFESDDIMPLKEIDGIYYVPLVFIERLNDIKTGSIDYFTDNFYIKYGDNFISFKISEDRIESKKISGEFITCKIHVIDWVIYVPAYIVSRALDITMETRPQYNTLRFSQKDARRTFDELIEKYTKPLFVPPTDPPPTPPPPPATTAPPVERTTAPPIITIPPPTSDVIMTTEYINDIPTVRTTEPTTPEPTTPENTREIENYLLFYDSDTAKLLNEKTEKINEVLKTLDKNNIKKAIFFLSAGEIIDNPDILRKIYASGHELGIKFESGRIDSDAGDLISELESANSLIYSALKHKTRFCMFDEIIEIPDELEKLEKTEKFEEPGESYENKLKEYGYYLCEKTSDIPDLDDIKNSNEMIEYMKQKTMNVFMFDLNSGYKNYLQLFAQAAEIKFYINFSYINNANIEKIKERINMKDGD